MSLFDEKQVELLSKYEPVFYTVTYQQYKRGTTAKQNEFVADMLENVTGKPANRNFSCNSCLYNLWVSVARIYYSSVEALKNNKVSDEQPLLDFNDVNTETDYAENDGDSKSLLHKESSESGKGRKTKRNESRRTSKG